MWNAQPFGKAPNKTKWFLYNRETRQHVRTSKDGKTGMVRFWPTEAEAKAFADSMSAV